MTSTNNSSTGAHDPTRSTTAIAALASGIQAANAYDRLDLAHRLDVTRHRLLEPAVQVVVIGEFKQGKSSLVNALLNSRVCPVDDDIATAVPTSVSHGDQRAAWAIVATPGADAADEASLLRQEIDFNAIPDYATERAMDPTLDVRGVDVRLPRRLLEDGLMLIDTPGVGGLGSAHATAALGALSVADAAIFLSDASQEYTMTEMGFLEQAFEMCPNVICVMTKIDFYPAWRRVLEINEGHLRRAGHELDILPVSASLRIEAIRRDDTQLNEESGFPALVSLLTNEVVGQSAEREKAKARQDLTAVADQLISQFDAELASLNDPAARASLIRRLEDAKTRSEQLRNESARWSTTLNDGIGDLTSNVDFDFRDRMRRVTTEGDEAIGNSDPGETWAEFEPWLASRVSYEVVHNYRFLTDSSVELSRNVAEHFQIDGGEVLEQLDVQNPSAVLARISTDTSIDVDGSTVQARGMTLLRGSYSGVLMFGMLGSMLGVALGPIPIVIGLAMGRKSLKDEKERQVTQRRTQAKNAARRYSDEVTFQVNKDSRDTLRRTQRQIRDFYTARAEELHRSTSEALAAATAAAKTDESARAGRIRDIEAELKRLNSLRGLAVSLVDDPHSMEGVR